MAKILRVTTVPMALKVLLRGQMRYMRESGFEVVMVSADGEEREDVVEYEACRHEVIHMTRKITPLADLRSLWKLYRFIKNEKPDIVHSHTPKAGLLAMLAARLAGVRIRIHTIAGLRFMTSTGITRRILVRMEKLTSSAATHVWPNSPSLLNYVKQNRLASGKKLQLIGKGSSNGIDLSRFSEPALTEERIGQVKQVIGYDPAFTYLLAVGRIVKDKGIAELVSAFAKLYESDDKLRLVLVGSFEDHLDPLDSGSVQLLKTHPGIIMPGWYDDVEYFMHISDIFVHPSYREGFPNVILQAGAMGCPVLCSRITGNVDIVDDGINGLVFNPRDADDLLATLKRALADPAGMEKMACLLRKKIEDNFDRKYVQARLKEKYLELLEAEDERQ